MEWLQSSICSSEGVMTAPLVPPVVEAAAKYLLPWDTYIWLRSKKTFEIGMINHRYVFSYVADCFLQGAILPGLSNFSRIGKTPSLCLFCFWVFFGIPVGLAMTTCVLGQGRFDIIDLLKDSQFMTSWMISQCVMQEIKSVPLSAVFQICMFSNFGILFFFFSPLLHFQWITPHVFALNHTWCIYSFQYLSV